MDYKYLLFSRENGTGIVTINRPQVLNALNIDVFSELYAMFTDMEKDASIKSVVLTGSGDRAFAAGVDITEMQKEDFDINNFIKIARRAGDQIYNLTKPVIAAVNGYAYGGGNELALCCDLRIASENARFAQQEINLGIIPGGGAIQRLTRLIGMTKAKELVFTGDEIDAATALELGFINRVVSREKLMDESLTLAQKLSDKSSIALALAKKAFNTGIDMSLAEGLDMDERYFAACFRSEDRKEAMKAFVEKKRPEFKGE